jgi:putative membrane protein
MGKGKCTIQTMMKLLFRVLAVGVAAYVVPGVNVSGIWSAIAVAIVLGILNSVLRPILLLLTIPINVMTLGLFTLVVNTAMVLLTAKIVPSFTVNGFWPALLFSVVLWLVNWFLEALESG